MGEEKTRRAKTAGRGTLGKVRGGEGRKTPSVAARHLPRRDRGGGRVGKRVGFWWNRMECWVWHVVCMLFVFWAGGL